MAAPVRRRADNIKWLGPNGKGSSLTPMSGGRGLLEIELMDANVVMIHSRNCLLVEGGDDSFMEVAEFEATLPLDRCQITWKLLEKSDATEVERSAYYAD